MIELALVTLILGCFIGAVVWLMNWSGKAGANDEVVDEQKRVIQELQKANADNRRRADIARNTPVSGAADRLRQGPFVRD